MTSICLQFRPKACRMTHLMGCRAWKLVAFYLDAGSSAYLRDARKILSHHYTSDSPSPEQCSERARFPKLLPPHFKLLPGLRLAKLYGKVRTGRFAVVQLLGNYGAKRRCAPSSLMLMRSISEGNARNELHAWQLLSAYIITLQPCAHGCYCLCVALCQANVQHT